MVAAATPFIQPYFHVDAILGADDGVTHSYQLRRDCGAVSRLRRTGRSDSPPRHSHPRRPAVRGDRRPPAGPGAEALLR